MSMSAARIRSVVTRISLRKYFGQKKNGTLSRLLSRPTSRYDDGMIMTSGVVASMTMAAGIFWIMSSSEQESADDETSFHAITIDDDYTFQSDDKVADGDLLDQDTLQSWRAAIIPLSMSLPHLILEPSRTKCEMITPATAMTRFSQLRRHHTIKKMESSASKDTVQSKYNVNWNNPLGEGAFGAVYIGTDRKNENFDEGNFYYLVLDLVSGGEMFEHLCNQGPYSEADAARLVREIASALAFLHGLGVVHSDLKPENLMLSSKSTSDAVIKVVDFGCAQVIDPDGPGSESFRGTANTPAYSPPEVLGNKKKRGRLDPSYDMWAMGVILYIMLTGVHPFDLYGNAKDSEIEHQVLSGQKPPLRNSPLTAHLSPDAIDLIDKLLQWDPTKRLTADELLENLWVRGDTARKIKIADSDKRLSAYRAFKTKLEAKVFAEMVSWSDEQDNDIAKKTSLIERAFHRLDPEHRGYVTTEELRKLTTHGEPPSEGGEDNQLSLSGFSDLIADNMKNRYYPKGTIVYREGDKGHAMYFLNSGSIEVYTHDGFVKTLRQPGDFFGEGALLHPKGLRSASIRCVTPVHALEISREYFEKYLASEMDAKLNLRETDKARKRQRAKTILRLQKDMKEVSFRQGEYLFKSGEEGKEMYILEEGVVDISIQGHTVFSGSPGEMVGEHSLIFSRPRNVSARCVSKECKAHVLRARDFFALLDSHPSLKESVRDICLRREFQKALCYNTKKRFPKGEKELRQAFDALDTNHSGELELDNVKQIIRGFDPTYSDQEVQDILKSLDLDESGCVSWAEFKRIFGMDKVKDASL